MNILQNNVSGRPLMIPVKEGLNGDSWWKKGWRWLWVPLLMVAAIALTAFVFGPNKTPAEKYRDKLEQFFISEGYSDFETSRDFSIFMKVSNPNDPYDGYLQANVSEEWYLPVGDDGTLSEQPVWSGFYNSSVDVQRIVSYLSEDGSRLTRSADGKRVDVSLEENPNRRVYSTQYMILYYDGGNEEINTLLEKLCGKPVADGRIADNG